MARRFCFSESRGAATKITGTSPTRAVSDALAKLLPALSHFGITRLANITGLDDVGYPVWQAIRPNARSLSVAQGKGPDDATAKVSAIMESLEAHHAEHPRCALRIESRRVLLREGLDVADPSRLPRTKAGLWHEDLPIPWAEGRDLSTGAPLLVPFEMVHSNFTVPRLAGSGLFIASSNGMGAGNHPAEAVLQGLLELVERDAEALFRLGGAQSRAASRVELASVDDANARSLVARLERAGLRAMIWDMTSDIRLPCFSVVIFDLASDPDLNPRPAAEGSGCDFDRGAALCRALGEAMQSRLTSIAGSRDDLSAARYDSFQSEASLRYWREQASAPATKRFSDAPTAPAHATVDEDVELVVDRLAERGLDRVAFVDLPSSGFDVDFDFSFIRAIVPGLEGSSASPSYLPGRRAHAKMMTG